MSKTDLISISRPSLGKATEQILFCRTSLHRPVSQRSPSAQSDCLGGFRCRMLSRDKFDSFSKFERCLIIAVPDPLSFCLVFFCIRNCVAQVESLTADRVVTLAVGRESQVLINRGLRVVQSNLSHPLTASKDNLQFADLEIVV